MMPDTEISVPEVSVVMSVFNGANRLAASMVSILDQEGCDLEFIVVDDGSTDGSGSIIDDWAARDSRVRAIHLVRNGGLTNALIRGSSEARGQFIARQDCGDVSLAGRLAEQATALRLAPDAVMVAMGARFVGPGDEKLFEVVRPGTSLHEGLAARSLEELVGPPHHGATMFRRATYLAVGGYRPAFVVAQDIDLWLRLAERGRCVGLSHIGYLARMDAGSISSRRRQEQVRLAQLAIECAECRRRGMPDQHLIDDRALSRYQVSKRGALTRSERARFFYFVGSCLRRNDSTLARKYFRMAVAEQPLFVRALWRAIAG
jgi:glycosyltransferase involved in cell wall biosynthesis